MLAACSSKKTDQLCVTETVDVERDCAQADIASDGTVGQASTTFEGNRTAMKTSTGSKPSTVQKSQELPV